MADNPGCFGPAMVAAEGKVFADGASPLKCQSAADAGA